MVKSILHFEREFSGLHILLKYARANAVSPLLQSVPTERIGVFGTENFLVTFCKNKLFRFCSGRAISGEEARSPVVTLF